MINTEDYNHEYIQQWVISGTTVLSVAPPANRIVATDLTPQDATLIADAPLLLEEVKRLQKYSNVLEKLMGLLDSRDEGDWILLETIDELMKEEGIARWSEEKDKTETNLI
tara:strand:+ start:485 stop:817 length:333 start_codon:yes stop_codon:yes gene_type:complete